VSGGSRPGCPLAEFLSFPVNTKLYARLWLRDGVIHPAAHWVIRERLAVWAQRVEAAPAEIRDALALEAAPAGAPRQAPRAWVIPGATMPLPAPQSLAGEQKNPPRYPRTPPISECAEAIAAPREIQISPPRAYHRRVEPRGTGRWAQKRRLRVG
jgi:hypothetical protein